VNLFRPKAGKGYFFLWGNGVGPGSTGYEKADNSAGFVENYQIGAQISFFGNLVPLPQRPRAERPQRIRRNAWRIARILMFFAG